MQVIKNETSYLLKNDKGEYHLSIEDYEKLGESGAKKLAIDEIEKKSKSGSYSNVTINFDQARSLGFCEYGIKDFCKRLELDLDVDHNIKDVFNKVDIHTFKEYPDECLQLFTNKIFDKFGGIVAVLDQSRDRRTLDLVINKADISDTILHTLAYKSTLRVIDNFEKVYPNDDRPRKAIEAKQSWLKGEIDDKELSAARSAAESAWSAAESAAWSAARSAAQSAAESAAWSAARSAAQSAARSAVWSAESVARSAAWATTWSAARSAVWSAAQLKFQINTLIELIKEEK